MDVAREPHVDGSARRRRERRLRAWFRHEQFAIRCALASAKHHSHMRVASVATQTDFVLAATYSATASLAATFAATLAPVPVFEQVVPAHVATHAAPAPVFEYVASALVTENIAPAPAVPFDAPSQQFFPAYTTTTVTTDVNLDFTGLVKPQFPIVAVEASALQVV